MISIGIIDFVSPKTLILKQFFLMHEYRREAWGVLVLQGDKVLEMDGGDGYTTLCMYLISPTTHLKMAIMVNLF